MRLHLLASVLNIFRQAGLGARESVCALRNLMKKCFVRARTMGPRA